MKISILGTPYEFTYGDDKAFPKLAGLTGYCDTTIKQIVVADMLREERDPDAVADMSQIRKKTARHEIIHAMLYESGLAGNCDYADNEELVDWIAIQLPKLIKIMDELEIR